MGRKLVEYDEFLLSLICKGDKNAFNILFKNYYSGLVVFAHNYINDLPKSEEIVQDVFTKIWLERDSLEIKSNTKNWLFLAVKNKALDLLKHEKVKQKYHQYILNSNAEFYDQSFLLEDELRELIKDTMEKLPKECKKIFVLSRIKGLKNKEIAQTLGISIKTVENQMSKALKIFKKSLKDYL